MCDPFFAIILTKNHGRDYIVWDKTATIRFKKPGRATVRVRFHMPPEKIQEIKNMLDSTDKIEIVFNAEIIDDYKNLIAQVEKQFTSGRNNPPHPSSWMGGSFWA